MIDMAKNHADEYDINLFVPDLHSFTTPIDHSTLQAQIMHNLKLFVAAGLPLDNPHVRIYRQSYIPAHSELTVILNSFTGFGEMERMTQFKSKAKIQDLATRLVNRLEELESFNITEHSEAVEVALSEQKFISKLVQDLRHGNSATIGLFDYPVLMAADILLYGASYVPVGDDQSQHLEFTRDIAERMNSRFGELFTVPEPVKKQHEFFGKDQGLRIKDLADPTKKMSKSDESDKGVIFLGDSPETASKKIRSATTDSFGKVDVDNQDQPGIENLMQILALTAGVPLQEVKDSYAGQEQYGPLKNDAAVGVGEFLAQFQERLAQVDEAVLMAKLEESEAKMNEIANQTLLRVQKAVGLR